MTDIKLVNHQQWLEEAVANFSQLSQTARLDARVLLSYCLQKPLSYILAWPDRQITSRTMIQLNECMQRRMAGEPVAYITGIREFWSLNFKVTPEVLIPRSETELLVEWAIECITAEKQKSSDIVNILELGTGSGAIAIALAKEDPRLQIIATDISEKALQVAAENALLNKCTNIQFQKGHWFECVTDGDYDLILSNPPYIAADDHHLTQGDLPYEPECSLIAAKKGLSDIQILVADAKDYMHTGAWLGLEHGFEQAETVRKMMYENKYQQIRTIRDLAGMERITVCQWNDR